MTLSVCGLKVSILFPSKIFQTMTAPFAHVSAEAITAPFGDSSSRPIAAVCPFRKACSQPMIAFGSLPLGKLSAPLLSSISPSDPTSDACENDLKFLQKPGLLLSALLADPSVSMRTKRAALAMTKSFP